MCNFYYPPKRCCVCDQVTDEVLNQDPRREPSHVGNGYCGGGCTGGDVINMGRDPYHPGLVYDDPYIARTREDIVFCVDCQEMLLEFPATNQQFEDWTSAEDEVWRRTCSAQEFAVACRHQYYYPDLPVHVFERSRARITMIFWQWQGPLTVKREVNRMWRPKVQRAFKKWWLQQLRSGDRPLPIQAPPPNPNDYALVPRDRPFTAQAGIASSLASTTSMGQRSMTSTSAVSDAEMASESSYATANSGVATGSAYQYSQYASSEAEGSVSRSAYAPSTVGSYVSNTTSDLSQQALHGPQRVAYGTSGQMTPRARSLTRREFEDPNEDLDSDIPGGVRYDEDFEDMRRIRDQTGARRGRYY